jgi:hypothetical protein
LSRILAQIQALVAGGDFRVSEHGYDELADDEIFADEIVTGIEAVEAGRGISTGREGADGAGVAAR